MDSPIAAVDVVVTVIYHGDRVLLVYNPRWGAFTLPMTKLRQWPFGEKPTPARIEKEDDAAMRNVGECLGRTYVEAPTRLHEDIIALEQGDRESRSKRYQYRIFGFPVATAEHAPGIAAEWLRVDEILDEERRPISKTAESLVGQLSAEAKLRGESFPPR
jgi:hypothetical protein